MINKKHTVDEIFSKGLSDYKITPSVNAKKKLFASPEALKPLKPWFGVSKYLYFASSAVLVTSVATYFIFFNNNSTTSGLSTENNSINNTSAITIKNNNDLNNSVSSVNLYSESLTQPSDNENTVQNESFNNNTLFNKSVRKAENKIVTYGNTNPAGNVVKKNNNEDINTTFANNISSDFPIENTTGNKSELNNNPVSGKNREEVAEANSTLFSESDISALPVMVSGDLKDDRTSLDFIKILKPELTGLYNSDITLQTKKEADYVLKGFWFVELKSGCLISNYKVKTDNSELEGAAAAKQDLLQSSCGHSIQLNAVYLKKNLLFKAGLSYVSYGEKLSGNILLTNPQDKTQINFNNNAPFDIQIGGNYFNIDTIGGYFHYTYAQTDHIFISDSTWVWNTQNTPADVYDTTQFTEFDTLPKNICLNNFSYIEIPLSIGIVKPYGKFSLGFSACVYPGLLTAVKGSDMNIEHYPALEPYKKSNLQKFMISAGANLEIGYQINEKLLFSIEPFYKKALFNLYNKSTDLNQSFGSYGFRIGIRKLL